MFTLTIELPETLAQQVETSGITKQRLEHVVIQLVRAYLDEREHVKETWSDGAEFARRVIGNNRELFAELARR